MSRQCGFTKPSGEGCRGTVRQGDTYCWAHDPKYQEARKKGQSRSGKNKPSKELLAIKTRLSDLAHEVLEKRVDRADAAVASQVLNVYLRAIGMELKVREQQELEARLEELEVLLERNNGGRGYGS